jgi:hypothetical protein
MDVAPKQIPFRSIIVLKDILHDLRKFESDFRLDKEALERVTRHPFTLPASVSITMKEGVEKRRIQSIDQKTETQWLVTLQRGDTLVINSMPSLQLYQALYKEDIATALKWTEKKKKNKKKEKEKEKEEKEEKEDKEEKEEDNIALLEDEIDDFLDQPVESTAPNEKNEQLELAKKSVEDMLNGVEVCPDARTIYRQMKAEKKNDEGLERKYGLLSAKDLNRVVKDAVKACNTRFHQQDPVKKEHNPSLFKTRSVVYIPIMREFRQFLIQHARFDECISKIWAKIDEWSKLSPAEQLNNIKDGTYAWLTNINDTYSIKGEGNSTKRIIKNVFHQFNPGEKEQMRRRSFDMYTNTGQVVLGRFLDISGKLIDTSETELILEQANKILMDQWLLKGDKERRYWENLVILFGEEDKYSPFHSMLSEMQLILTGKLKLYDESTENLFTQLDTVHGHLLDKTSELNTIEHTTEFARLFKKLTERLFVTEPKWVDKLKTQNKENYRTLWIDKLKETTTEVKQNDQKTKDKLQELIPRFNDKASCVGSKRESYMRGFGYFTQALGNCVEEYVTKFMSLAKVS